MYFAIPDAIRQGSRFEDAILMPVSSRNIWIIDYSDLVLEPVSVEELHSIWEDVESDFLNLILSKNSFCTYLYANIQDLSFECPALSFKLDRNCVYLNGHTHRFWFDIQNLYYSKDNHTPSLVCTIQSLTFRELSFYLGYLYRLKDIIVVRCFVESVFTDFCLALLFNISGKFLGVYKDGESVKVGYKIYNPVPNALASKLSVQRLPG